MLWGKQCRVVLVEIIQRRLGEYDPPDKTTK